MDRQVDSVTNILRANQQHLEFLRLTIHHNDQRGPLFLPPNLKYLCASCDEDNGDELMIELAAEQCPKLCGIEVDDPLIVRTIAAISRFQKFVANNLDCYANPLFVPFSVSHFLGFVRIEIMKTRLVLCFVLEASAICIAWLLSAQQISRFLFIIIRFSGKQKFSGY